MENCVVHICISLLVGMLFGAAIALTIFNKAMKNISKALDQTK